MKNDVLVSALPKLVAQDNEQAADLLAYLGELDARRLYEEMGFNSIWEFCTEALGIGGPSLSQVPRYVRGLARGEIQLSVLAELHRCLDEQNADELLAQCRRMSFRQVQQLLAARFPKVNVKDSIRRAPDGVNPELRQALAVTTPEISAVAFEPSSTTSPDAAVLPADNGRPALPVPIAMPSHSPARPAHRQVEALSQGRFAVRFTADAEFLALLEEVRGLGAHRDPSGDLLTLLKAGLRAHQRELLKKRFAVGRTPRQRPKPEAMPQSTSASDSASADTFIPVSKRARASTVGHARPHIPAQVTRGVYERDGTQ